jgi:murein DD-endopeptidase MepM/ murein hydrolase activator NlpD
MGVLDIVRQIVTDKELAALLAAAAAAAYAWARQQRRKLFRRAVEAFANPKTAPGLSEGDAWVWPLPKLGGRDPDISDRFGSPRDGGARLHQGVDIVYPRERPLPKAVLPPKHEYRGYFVPDGTPVLAAHDGRIWFAGMTGTGWSVIIDHGPLPWATYYTHLASLAIPEHRRGKAVGGTSPLHIAAGAPIGTVGWSPKDAQQGRHLHFELRHGKVAVNPEQRMRASWRVVD